LSFRASHPSSQSVSAAAVKMTVATRFWFGTDTQLFSK
jgi:hypothetical protein